MPLKKYGIYLAYAPPVDLRSEGLGRYLAAFLRATSSHSDVRFTVVCPSWSRKNLLELCEAEGVPLESFDILTPAGTPAVLRFAELRRKNGQKKMRVGYIRKTLRAFSARTSEVRRHIERRIASFRNVSMLILLWVPMSLASLVIAVPAIILGFFARGIAKIFDGPRKFITQKIVARSANIRSIFTNSLFSRLFQYMEERELELMDELIKDRSDIGAWFCPTAFWPTFNNIKAPRLMCVPDVVMGDFPVGFSGIGGEDGVKRLNVIESALSNDGNFVTYSSHVKWNTLVNRYSTNPKLVYVVPHASNALDYLVSIKGFADPEKASLYYCQWRFKLALGKSILGYYIREFENREVKFIFYPSQFRPSKNVISLLRAYEFLLRDKYIGHKLILTGNPHEMPAIGDFVRDNNLENDVLFLHNLSVAELAACYKLADLAVNPSMAEGGCPFTFTEALSVNTPVVMARIPVTTEVITDPVLQDMMLFYPFDWQDMARSIEWALENREGLLATQKIAYTSLAERTWDTVVGEYIAILDRIAIDTPMWAGIAT